VNAGPHTIIAAGQTQDPGVGCTIMSSELWHAPAPVVYRVTENAASSFKSNARIQIML
jgi:hypothetical protein